MFFLLLPINVSGCANKKLADAQSRGKKASTYKLGWRHSHAEAFVGNLKAILSTSHQSQCNEKLLERR